MTQELNDKVLEALTQTMNMVGNIKDFTVEQAPDILQQAITYYGVYYFILFILGIILSCALVYGIIWLRSPRHWKKGGWVYESDSEPFVILFSMIITGVGATITSMLLNLQWLQIWLAPKVWLLEWLKELK